VPPVPAPVPLPVPAPPAPALVVLDPAALPVVLEVPVALVEPEPPVVLAPPVVLEPVEPVFVDPLESSPPQAAQANGATRSTMQNLAT
jgi:hypothetical protein